MRQLKRFTAIGIFFVIITGSLSHFLYKWTGENYIIGLLAPVNESIWEHMKLLFFPMLLYSFFMRFLLKEKYPCMTSSLCLGIIVGTFLIPALYYAYTCLLGRDIFLLDISTFLISIFIAFWLSYRFTLSCRLQPCTPFLVCLIGILLICFAIFTYRPPAVEIFKDPATGTYGIEK